VQQDVVSVDLIHDMAGLIGDFDGGTGEALAFVHQGPAGDDGSFPRGFHVRKFLAICIAGKVGAFADMEKIAGHGLGFAALFPFVTHERGQRSRNGP